MVRFPIWLAAVAASLFLLISRETPTFASSFQAPRPRLIAPHKQPPDSAENSLLGEIGSKSSSSAGGMTPGAVNWIPGDRNRTSPSDDDVSKTMREMRVQPTARQNSSSGGAVSAFSPAPVPTLQEFVETVRNNQRGVVAGIYVKGILALRVLPADPKDPLYVTIQPGAVTNTCGISRCPGVGLLAHNLLSGALFFRLTTGQEVDLVYGDGSPRRYIITKIRHLQALSPNDPYSAFVDLDTGGVRLSSSDVFAQTFGVPNRLVLQTCITANGALTWGRLFVIAEPM